MGYPDDVPTLTDGVVTLRRYTLDDLDGCIEQCTDPDSVAWTTIPVPYARDDGVNWITTMVPRFWTGGTGLEFAIEAAHQDGVRRYAGGISMRPQGEGVGDIGFAVHPGARGRGVGSRAIKLLVDWSFRKRGIDVITWFAYVGNWASRRAVWANGFSFHGTIAKFLLQRGERRDAWVGTLRADDTREPKTTWWVAPVLETARLRLRPFTDGDIDRIGELEDERSRRFGGRVTGARQPDGASALHRIREKMASGERIDWCVADRETDRLLGHLQLHDFDGLDDTEVKPGYVMHPDARGRGVLTEALRAMVDWAFLPVDDGGFGKRRITISTAASNTASRHAAEQAGFTQVATHPMAFTLGEHDFDDEVIYHRTNDSWHRPDPPS